MARAWEQVAVVAPGGTVSGVNQDNRGRCWLATGAGIFLRSGDAWEPLPQGQPLSQVSALVSAGELLIAGNSLGQIVYSRDGGETWFQSHVAQSSEPVTCLIASPNARRDGVVLAGTNGAGILRATDGGRYWKLSSFGLQDFTVMALATAPTWGRREVVFAGTAHGLYRSPNGGRAWKRVPLGDWAFQAVAVSPDFGRDGTVFSGTEAMGLFRSTDAGKTWQRIDVAAEAPPINTLWLHPGFASTPVCLAGTGDGRILRSEDGGEKWSCVAQGHAPVLCLAVAGERLYAGLHDRGLLVSDDDGHSWRAESDLAARAITRLLPGDGNELLAWGPMEGAWRSTDGGETWMRLRGLEGSQPLMTLATALSPEGPCLLVGTATGLLRSADRGESWERVLSENVIAVAFSTRFAEDGRAWVGTDTGDLLASSDSGRTWTPIRSPEPGIPLVALAARGETLAAATFDAGRRQLSVWRSAGAGQRWAAWFQEAADSASVQFVPRDGDAVGVLVAIGSTCWRATSDGWQRILEADAPIARLTRLSGQPDLIVLAAHRVLHSAAGSEWAPLNEGLCGQSLVDLALLPCPGAGSLAYTLGTGGVVWRRHVSFPAT